MVELTEEEIELVKEKKLISAVRKVMSRTNVSSMIASKAVIKVHKSIGENRENN